MNTYRAIQTEAGHWVVGWWVNGIWHGPVWGGFDSEAEASFYAYHLACMEYQEAPRSMPPAIDNGPSI